MRKNSKAVIVVGMHRSGTTAMMGCLELMGVSLGSGRRSLNENLELQRVNDLILRSYGSSWRDGSLDKPSLKNKRVNDKFVARIKNIIEKDFGKANIFSFKDPRLSLLLPIYKRALNELGIKDRKFIFMRRPADQVAKSLLRRDRMLEELTLKLYSKYVGRTKEGLVGEKFIEVDFGKMLENMDLLKMVYTTIFNKNMEEDIMKSIESFLNPKLKHF